MESPVTSDDHIRCGVSILLRCSNLKNNHIALEILDRYHINPLEVINQQLLQELIKHNHILNLQILFIKRASRPRDRWTGQTAFPGGKEESQDNKSPLVTAIRETFEEINIDLNNHWRALGFNGREKVWGVFLEVYSYVFLYTGDSTPILENISLAEVEECGWVPLDFFFNANSDNISPLEYISPGGLKHTFPSIPLQVCTKIDAQEKIYSTKEYILWGITLDIVIKLLCSFGSFNLLEESKKYSPRL